MEKKIVKFPFLNRKAEERIKRGYIIVIPWNGITIGEVAALSLSLEGVAIETDGDKKEVRIRKERGNVRL